MRLFPRGRRLAVVALPVAVVLILIAVVVARHGSGPAKKGPDQGRSAAPEVAQLACGVRALPEVEAPANGLPTDTATQTALSGYAIGDFAVNGTKVAVLAGSAVHLASTSGVPGATLTLSGAQPAQGRVLAIDDAGDVYLGITPDIIEKLSPSGAVLWSHQVGQQVQAVWSTGSGPGFRVGVVSTGVPGSTMYDATGAAAGTSPITGTIITDSGGVIYADDGEYVRVWKDGHLTQTFGDNHQTNDPQTQGGPWHFYQQGGAVPAPGGGSFVADGSRGIDYFSPEGYYRGLAADPAPTAAMPQLANDAMSENSRLLLVGSDVWYVGGGRNNNNQNITRIPVANLLALATAPSVPSYVLGPGAGITTPYLGQLVPVGKQPDLTAGFDPSWAPKAAGLRLRWTLTSSVQADQGLTGATKTVQLPTSPAALGRIPLALPSIGPGAYEVDARLLDASGASVGATCLYVTVASAGDRLDLAGLPGKPDPNGAAPQRVVALAAELGTGSTRVGLDWSQLLPGGASSTAPEVFTAYDAEFQAAAAEALTRGVTWWVTVGQTDHAGIVSGLIANGTWGKRVAELVTHFKGVVPAWEAYNEPNNAGFSPADYVAKVLAPFSQAVHASDPAAKVIGGSTLNVSVDYWKAISAAGGLSMMDVAGVHPYTGHNRSWEEQGTVASLTQLQGVVGKLPLWDTESAWWSDGPANIFHTADDMARTEIWMRTLKMSVWSYFLTEGAYGDFGDSYSLIQSDNAPDDYVKPAALSIQTAAAQLDGRPFLGLAPTGVPHVYAARFGPKSGSGDDLLATWSDNTRIPVHLNVTGSQVPVDLTDEYGAQSHDALRAGHPVGFVATSAVSYFSYPAAGGLSVGPSETYGPDVLAGGLAAASTAAPGNPASAAVDGISDAQDGGDPDMVPTIWASQRGDPQPSLTVTLTAPVVLNRIDVVSHSIGSSQPGLSDYDVQVSDGGDNFRTVASVRGNLTQRTEQVTFPPTMARSVRLTVLAAATTPYAGGRLPWFEKTSAGPAQALVYELEGYAGTAGAQQLSDRDVPSFGSGKA